MLSHCILVVHITLYAACWNFLNILFLFAQGSLRSKSNVGWTFECCVVFKRKKKKLELDKEWISSLLGQNPYIISQY